MYRFYITIWTLTSNVIFFSSVTCRPVHNAYNQLKVAQNEARFHAMAACQASNVRGIERRSPMTWILVCISWLSWSKSFPTCSFHFVINDSLSCIRPSKTTWNLKSAALLEVFLSLDCIVCLASVNVFNAFSSNCQRQIPPLSVLTGHFMPVMKFSGLSAKRCVWNVLWFVEQRVHICAKQFQQKYIDGR